MLEQIVASLIIELIKAAGAQLLERYRARYRGKHAR